MERFRLSLKKTNIGGTKDSGKHTIVFDFKYDGPGLEKGGTGVLSVDGKPVASKAISQTVPFLLTIDESFDVGVDLRTPVDDNDYQAPFRFTGKLAQVTINLRPEPMSADDRKRLNEGVRRAILATE